MPELPEVETIVRELREVAEKKTISDSQVLTDSVVWPDAVSFKNKIRGLQIKTISRKGKFLVLELSKGMMLVIHLRMTGRLMWRLQKGRDKYIRVIFAFSDGSRLIFSDMRKFGKVWLCSKKYYEKITGIARLGVEPLSDFFGYEEFKNVLANKKGRIKNLLLRQDLIAGIGNIYADEICHMSHVCPTSRIECLKDPKLRDLYHAIRYCLNEGINHCGVSVSDFVGTRGNQGKHQHYLKVYGREGKRCRSCKSLIKKIRVAGRGTYYCPFCQEP